jgi:two-component system sensor histidine kinase UhpB
VIVDDQYPCQRFLGILHHLPRSNFLHKSSSPFEKQKTLLKPRIVTIWPDLSLRARLFLPLAAMFVVALILGAVLLRSFAAEQLIEENEPAVRSARQLAEAINATLQFSANPQQTLEAFGQSLGTGGTIRFRRAQTSSPAAPLGATVRGAPGWFVELLALPDMGAAFPILIDGNRVGDIVFAPDMSVDIHEKWIGFLAILVSAIALALLTGIIAYVTAGAAVRPLRDLGEGLTRMREGDYGKPVAPAGPPEIRRSVEEANQLAQTLQRLSRDNRSLLRKIVSLQDDERRDLARELHDELGPLLFGIRANAVALLDVPARDKAQLDDSVAGLVQSVEALQQANRRILDRLRPLHIDELGLTKSIETLLRNARSQAPRLQQTTEIDPRLREIDGLLSHTVYRVIQEGVTNVLRHAGAGAMKITASLQSGQLLIEVADNGVGIAPDNVFGRGLTGMHERVRALGGTFELLRENGLTCIRCRLPVGGPG